MRIAISKLQNFHSKVSDQEILTWKQLCEKLTSFREITESGKMKVPLWTPCKFENQGRRKKDAIEVSCLVLDFDTASEDEIHDAVELIENKWKCRLILHSTASHREGSPKVRIVVPFDAPVPAEQWPRIFHSLVKNFPGADTQCSDSNRAFFEPSKLKNVESWEYIGKGGLLKWADTAPDSPVQAFSGAQSTQVTLAMVKRASVSMRGNSDPAKAADGERLWKLANGFKLAEQGERDAELFALCGALVKKWPTLDPEATSKLFEKSISHWMGEFTLENVQDKLQRALEYNESIQEEKRQKIESEHELNCACYWQTTPEAGRASDYNEEDVSILFKLAGIKDINEDSLKLLGKRWLLQKASNYWILTKYGYRMVSKDDVSTACRDMLAPARSLGVDVWKMGDSDIELMQVSGIMAKYGTVVHKVLVSCVKTESYFDPEEAAIVEVHMRKPDFTPTYHQEIEEWLMELAGENFNAINRWLYWLHDIQRPCAALFLSGPGGTGKSLLVRGLAKIWGSGSGTPYSIAVSDANFQITTCPLVVAEESLRTRQSKSADMDLLRDFIQARDHNVRKLYHPHAEMRGAIRLIIAAQKPEILHSDDSNLNIDDANAISERICLIQVRKAAQEYLLSFPPEELESWADHKIAEHVAFLWEAYNYKPQGRFLVRVDSTSAQRTAAAMSPRAQELIDIIARDVSSKGGMFTPGLTDGKPCVKVDLRKIIDNWASWMDTNKPKSQAMANALKPLCLGRHKGTYIVDMTPVKRLASDVGLPLNVKKLCTMEISIDKDKNS